MGLGWLGWRSYFLSMDIDAETLLGGLGLKQKDSSGMVLTAVGTFILGGIIGAGVALLFAPAGPWRRKGTWDRVDEAKDELVKAAHGELAIPVPASASRQPAKSV